MGYVGRMLAPDPRSVQLVHDRVRCACGADCYIVQPEAWYEGQQSMESEVACPQCERSLTSLLHPEGAVVRVYTSSTLPDAVAKALGREVVDEVCTNRPVVAGGDERWSEPHEAPAAWVAVHTAAQAKVAERQRAIVIQDMAITAVLVVAVALLALI